MTVHEILLDVARKHRLKIEDMKSRRRERYVVAARVDFIRRAAAERNLSDAQIGRFINRTSWTVRHHRDEAVADKKRAKTREWSRRVRAEDATL